jgi:hypothetical protein
MRIVSGNKAEVEVEGWKLEQSQNPHPENRRDAAPPIKRLRHPASPLSSSPRFPLSRFIYGYVARLHQKATGLSWTIRPINPFKKEGTDRSEIQALRYYQVPGQVGQADS